MSEKMTCPGCDSHTSSVLGAVRDGLPCPYCGLPAASIVAVHDIRAARADQELKDVAERLTVENGRLQYKVDSYAEIVRLIVDVLRESNVDAP